MFSSRLYRSNMGILIIALVLLCFGLIMVYSSSVLKKDDSYYFLKKQFLWTLVGLAMFLFFLCYDYHNLHKWIYPMLLFTIVLLVLVLLIGKNINGARRWIVIGPANFQPAELAKLTIILFLADYLDRKHSKIKNYKSFLNVLVIIGIITGLIVLEKDLGTPILLFAVSIILLFIAGIKIRYIAGLMLVSLPVMIYWGIFAVSYRMQRLMSFWNPWGGAADSTYQLRQSFMALGSGGLTGRGLGNSEFKNLYLPEMHTDFIFSITGEEIGFVGTFIIIFLFTWFLVKGFKIARNAPDLFSKIISIGITFFIVIQAYINMGVCSGCLPTKGMPLPFFSYGGSSLMITMAMVGILANISQHSVTPAMLFRYNFRTRRR